MSKQQRIKEMQAKLTELMSKLKKAKRVITIIQRLLSVFRTILILYSGGYLILTFLMTVGTIDTNPDSDLILFILRITGFIWLGLVILLMAIEVIGFGQLTHQQNKVDSFLFQLISQRVLLFIYEESDGENEAMTIEYIKKETKIPSQTIFEIAEHLVVQGFVKHVKSSTSIENNRFAPVV